MNDKQLYLFDGQKMKDDCKFYDTEIKIYTEGTNELLFKGKNKVVIAGAGFTARQHFDLPGEEITPSYNAKLLLDNTASEDPTSMTKCILFAVGTDGCGPENSQVYPVDYKKWIAPDALIPFKYVNESVDIDPADKSKYFGKKTANGKIAYYFKGFETTPILVQQFADGTPIDGSIYDSTKADDAETYVELNLKITKEDCRDFFISTSTINDARVNTISLLTAWAKVIDGITYYQDIRPLTKLNFPNETLIDLTKGLDIIYHIYY